MAAEKITRPAVLAAVENVQTELAKVGIAKEGKNAGQGFKFRGIDQVLGTLSGLLAVNRVILVCREPNAAGFGISPNHVEVRPTKAGGTMNVSILTRRVVAVSLIDGSELDMGTYSGEGADSGDKSTSKAHSMLYKYAAFLGFCIPLQGVLDDADSDNPADEPSKAPSSPAEAPKAAKATKPASKAAKATESPTAPAKTQSDPVDDGLAAIKAVTTLDAAEKLALTLRGLRAHERFTEVKVALKARIAELSKESE